MTLEIEKLDAINGDYDHKWKVYKAALAYTEAGYYVVPIVKGGKALPAKKYGITYGNAAKARKTIEKWFNPDKGAFAGWNIGIATGKENGVFVMDVDRHGKEDGFETLKHLLDQEKMPSGPVQETPNNGKHYLFRWQDNATSSTGKIGPGIDTRGGDVNSCKGHIVAFPSVVDGGEYKWISGGLLPDIPKWVMDKMGVPWRPSPRGVGRGNEMVEDADMEETVPLEQVHRLLASINPDDLEYDDWLRIGMAIKSQYPGQDGLGAWDEWSSHGSRYKQNECLIRWNAFSEAGTVRMATLFHHAKLHGHEPKPTDKKPNRLAMVTERMNENHAVVVIGNKIRILVEIEGEIEEMASTYNLLGRQDFRTLYENDTICTNPEKGKYVSVADIWLGDPARRTYPKGIGMFPNGEPEGYYNTWRGFAVESAPGDCTLFKNHINKVVCGGNTELNTFVLDWCADLFQDPANPKGTAIVMRGDEGTGKGTFANTIGMMCAPHYTHLIDENHLTGQFNAHMSDSVVVYADEITWGGNRKTSGKLKGLVTERHMLLERKGIDAVTHRNMAHLLVASNSQWVIPAGAKSRRWLILDIDDKARANKKYFDDLNKEMNNGGKEAFLHEMLNRKITSNLTIAPETEALQEHREMSTTNEDSVLRWWKHVLAKGVLHSYDVDNDDNVGWPAKVTKADIYEEYEDYCIKRHLHPQVDNPFFKQMVKYGCSSIRKRLPGGTRLRCYNIPPVEEALKILEQVTGIIVEGDNDE